MSKVARRAARRDANEALIIEAMRAAGAFVWQLDQPVDLLVWSRLRRLLLAVEVKGKGGKLTEGQREFFRMMVDEDAPVYVVRTIEEALAAVRG